MVRLAFLQEGLNRAVQMTTRLPFGDCGQGMVQARRARRRADEEKLKMNIEPAR